MTAKKTGEDMGKHNFKNTLWTRDNIEVLHGMNSDSVDLIYLDPPFNSKRLYSAPIGSKAAGVAFKDTWTWNDVNEAYLEKMVSDYPSIVKLIETAQIYDSGMAAYITYMAQRIIEMYRILKSTGSLYLHCDPTASHYLKIMLDGVFGENRFVNEIIWHYTSGGAGKKWFARKHDTILLYSKTDKYYFSQQKYKRFLDKSKGYDPRIEYFKDEETGRDYRLNIMPDVWTDIGIISPNGFERLGYPTQKPLKLLERIILSSSKEGDIVLDPFCGCATACVAAQKLQRQWLGIDIEEKATEILIERLSDDAGLFSDFVHRSDAPQRTDINSEPISKTVRERLFKMQKGICAGCGKAFDILNLEVDHIVPKTKGGGDYFENYQLLCGSCNRIKGARPMEYLRQKIRTREAVINKISFGD